jgi:signal transduction histidine kinase
LAPIAMGAAVLSNIRGAPEKVGRMAEIIGRQAKHMKELVDDLLDVSRIARGLLRIDGEPISVLNLAKSSVEQVQPLLVVLGDRHLWASRRGASAICFD